MTAIYMLFLVLSISACGSIYDSPDEIYCQSAGAVGQQQPYCKDWRERHWQEPHWH